jgi:hypothetical protein
VILHEIEASQNDWHPAAGMSSGMSSGRRMQCCIRIPASLAQSQQSFL